MITREQVKEYIFNNCPGFETAWSHGDFDDGHYFLQFNDYEGLESQKILLHLALYFTWLLLSEQYRQVQQVSSVIEKLFQEGTKKVAEDLTFYFIEILYMKTKETRLLTEKLELLFSKESLKWYTFIKQMPCYNR